MPTVDDLVISLTIKETSRLSDLQNQLEAIVGKKGEKAPIFGIDPSLKADLTFIKRKMSYLVPVVAPRSIEKEKMKAYAASTKLLIQRYKGEISDFLSKLPEKEMEKMFNEFNVKTEDELSKAIEFLFEDFAGEAEDIFKGLAGGEKSKRALDALTNFIKTIREEEGLKVTTLRELIEAFPEPQERWEKILKKLGLLSTGQFRIFKLKEEILEGNDKIEAWLEKNQEGIKNFEKYFEGKDAVYDPLIKALKDLGYGDDLKAVLDDVAKIRDDVNLQNLLGAMMKAFKEGTPARVSRSFKEYIQKDIKPLGKLSPARGKPMKLDINAFKDASKLLSVLPEQAEEIQKTLKRGYVALELKNVLRENGFIRDQIRNYVEIFGDKLVILTRMATTEGLEMARGLGAEKIIILPNLREVEKQLKMERVISGIEETQEELIKLADKISEKEVKQAKQILGEYGVRRQELEIPSEEKVGELGKKLIENVMESIGKFDSASDEMKNDIDSSSQGILRDFGLMTQENLNEINKFFGLGSKLKLWTRSEKNSEIIMEQFVKPYYEKLRAEEAKIPFPELLSELGKGTTNEEIKVISEKILSQYEKGSVLWEQIKALVEGFMNIIKRTTDEPGTQTGFPEG